MQSLLKSGKAVPQADQLEYPAQRPYEAAQLWTFGYGSANDDGLGNGCGGGVPPCHKEGNTATQLLHGNFDNLTSVATWASGMNNILPASFYLAGKPAWWGTLPFPAIGPDVKGSTGPSSHSSGNPAQSCYLKVMGGSDGGQGGPLTFNAGNCYVTDKIVSIPARLPGLSRSQVEPVSLKVNRK